MNVSVEVWIPFTRNCILWHGKTASRQTSGMWDTFQVRTFAGKQCPLRAKPTVHSFAACQWLLLQARSQGRNEGGKGGTMPGAPNHWVAPKSPNNVTNTFFNTAHLLPRDLRFELEGTRLVSCPGRHLPSVRLC